MSGPTGRVIAFVDGFNVYQFPARIPVPGGAIECPDVWVPEISGPDTCESSL